MFTTAEIHWRAQTEDNGEPFLGDEKLTQTIPNLRAFNIRLVKEEMAKLRKNANLLNAAKENYGEIFSLKDLSTTFTSNLTSNIGDVSTSAGLAICYIAIYREASMRKTGMSFVDITKDEWNGDNAFTRLIAILGETSYSRSHFVEYNDSIRQEKNGELQNAIDQVLATFS